MTVTAGDIVAPATTFEGCCPYTKLLTAPGTTVTAGLPAVSAAADPKLPLRDAAANVFDPSVPGAVTCVALVPAP